MAAERSKRIMLSDQDKVKLINKETIKLLNKYSIDMELRGLSEKSIYGYKCDLINWFVYVYEFQSNECVTKLDEDEVTEFIYFCKSNGNNSRRLKRRMSSISAFYKYLKKKRIITENPMEFIDRIKKDVDVVTQNFISQEQVDLLRQKLNENGDIQLNLFANLSLSTMARVNAIANIEWEKIDFENRQINDVVEKEGYIVTLYFNEITKNLLLELKKQREENGINCKYVFTSKYRGEYNLISNTTLAEWAKKCGDMIGVKNFHPHDFRHSMATLLKQSGMPLESVSKLLQHKSTDVTLKHYIKEDTKKIQAEKDLYEI